MQGSARFWEPRVISYRKMDSPPGVQTKFLDISKLKEEEKDENGGKEKLERIFSMQGGSGDTSYFQNSSFQAYLLREVRPLLEEAIQNTFIWDSNHLRIADLGCSCSINTVVTISTIVNKMKNKYLSKSMAVPEFEVLFSDLPSNDFNTLFGLLPPFGKSNAYASDSLCDAYSIKEERDYFAAAVPGSFYNRLFPEKSLHFVHSSFSLHWLSQVPCLVEDKTSVAWNRGRVFINNGHPAVVEAYSQQHKKDLHSFLTARSVEVVSGGCVFLVCLGRSNPDPSKQSALAILFGTYFEDAWDSLISQGLVDESKRDGFNIPAFAPSVEEFRQVVEQESSFSIKTLEVSKGASPISQYEKSHFKEKGGVGRLFVNSCRSVCENLVECQLGNTVTDMLFEQMEQAAEANAEKLVEDLAFEKLVAVLERN